MTPMTIRFTTEHFNHLINFVFIYKGRRHKHLPSGTSVLTLTSVPTLAVFMTLAPCGANHDFLLKLAPPSRHGTFNYYVGNTDGRLRGGACVTATKCHAVTAVKLLGNIFFTFCVWYFWTALSSPLNQLWFPSIHPPIQIQSVSLFTFLSFFFHSDVCLSVCLLFGEYRFSLNKDSFNYF